MKIGIIGAGFVGRAIGKLAVRAGHQAMLSNSRGPQTLFSLRPCLGCEIGTVEEAMAFGEIVVVAVPLLAYCTLPAAPLADKLVIDAFGFDVVDAGALAEGWRFEHDRPAYCVPLDREALAKTQAATSRT